MESDFLKRSKRKRLWKRIALVIIIAVVVGLLLYNFVGRHGGGIGSKGKLKATIEIRCDNLSKNMDALKKPELKQYVPKNGQILPEETFKLKKGTTAFDLTQKACEQNNIQFEYKKSVTYNSIYVKGINYLYEFSAGKKSGWMYTVNGESPEYGADQYQLKDGDKVVWYYVVDYTKEGRM